MKDVGGPTVYRLVEAGGRPAVCPGGGPSRSRRRPGFGLYCGVILGSYWVYVGVIFGIYWVYIGVILGIYWGHIGSILGLYSGI